MENIVREYCFGGGKKSNDGYIKISQKKGGTVVYITEKKLEATLSYSHFISEIGFMHMMQCVLEEPDVVLQEADQSIAYKKHVYGKRHGNLVQLTLDGPLFMQDFAKGKPGVVYSYSFEIQIGKGSVCEGVVDELHEQVVVPKLGPTCYDISSPRFSSQEDFRRGTRSKLFIFNRREPRKVEICHPKSVSIQSGYSSDDDSSSGNDEE